MGVAGQASATCLQRDLTGRWAGYAFTYQRGLEPSWTPCTIFVASNGAIAEGSACSNSSGRSAPMAGQMTVTDSASCLVSGYFILFGVQSSIDRMTLSSTKNHVDGVGTASDSVFFMTGSKI